MAQEQRATNGSRPRASAWLRLTIGGALLLVPTLVVIGGVYYVITERKADVEAFEQAAKVIKAQADPTDKDGGTAPPNQPLAINSAALERASEVCKRAILCCRAVARKGGADEAVQRACDGFSGAGDKKCENLLETYRKTASIVGIACD